MHYNQFDFCQCQNNGFIPNGQPHPYGTPQQAPHPFYTHQQTHWRFHEHCHWCGKTRRNTNGNYTQGTMTGGYVVPNK